VASSGRHRRVPFDRLDERLTVAAGAPVIVGTLRSIDFYRVAPPFGECPAPCCKGFVGAVDNEQRTLDSGGKARDRFAQAPFERQ